MAIPGNAHVFLHPGRGARKRRRAGTPSWFWVAMPILALLLSLAGAWVLVHVPLQLSVPVAPAAAAPQGAAGTQAAEPGYGVPSASTVAWPAVDDATVPSF